MTARERHRSPEHEKAFVGRNTNDTHVSVSAMTMQNTETSGSPVCRDSNASAIAPVECALVAPPNKISCKQRNDTAV